MPNFGQMTAFIIQFQSGDKILSITLWTDIMTSKSLFHVIIKIAITLIITTFKNSIRRDQTDSTAWLFSKSKMEILELKKASLHKKCPYSELFWSAFSHSAGKCGPE